MQHAGGRVDLADLLAPWGDDSGQFRDARRIGAGRPADKHFLFGDKDVATLDETVLARDFHDLRIQCPQMRGHFRRLTQTRRRTGPHDDGALRQAQGGILYKDAVGIGLQRGQFDHGRPGFAQGRNIGVMVRLHQRKVRGAGINRAQPLDDAGCRTAGDGVSEVGGKGHAGPQKLATVSHP
jgi:hypothetical protein